MAASYEEYREAFAEHTGSDDAQRTWYNEYAGNWFMWADLFESTGVDSPDPDETITAFRDFLTAFYPEQGLSKDDWQDLRQQFYDMYDLSDSDIDWEAYREAIGY